MSDNDLDKASVRVSVSVRRNDYGGTDSYAYVEASSPDAFVRASALQTGGYVAGELGKAGNMVVAHGNIIEKQMIGPTRRQLESRNR